MRNILIIYYHHFKESHLNGTFSLKVRCARKESIFITAMEKDASLMLLWLVLLNVLSK